jgi:hypothetical protein
VLFSGFYQKYGETKKLEKSAIEAENLDPWSLYIYAMKEQAMHTSCIIKKFWLEPLVFWLRGIIECRLAGLDYQKNPLYPVDCLLVLQRD